jgi:hypothetical protein
LCAFFFPFALFCIPKPFLMDFNFIPPVYECEVLALVLLLVHGEGFLHQLQVALPTCIYIFYPAVNTMEANNFSVSFSPMIFAIFAVSPSVGGLF